MLLFEHPDIKSACEHPNQYPSDFSLNEERYINAARAILIKKLKPYPDVVHAIEESIQNPGDIQLQEKANERLLQSIMEHSGKNPEPFVLAAKTLPIEIDMENRDLFRRLEQQQWLYADKTFELAESVRDTNPVLAVKILHQTASRFKAHTEEDQFFVENKVRWLDNIRHIVKTNWQTNPDAALYAIRATNGNRLVSPLPKNTTVVTQHLYSLYQEALAVADAWKESKPQASLAILQACLGHGQMVENDVLWTGAKEQWNETAYKIKKIAVYLGEHFYKDQPELTQQIIAAKHLESSVEPPPERTGFLARFLNRSQKSPDVGIY